MAPAQETSLRHKSHYVRLKWIEYSPLALHNNLSLHNVLCIRIDGPLLLQKCHRLTRNGIGVREELSHSLRDC